MSTQTEVAAREPMTFTIKMARPIDRWVAEDMSYRLQRSLMAAVMAEAKPFALSASLHSQPLGPSAADAVVSGLLTYLDSLEVSS